MEKKSDAFATLDDLPGGVTATVRYRRFGSAASRAPLMLAVHGFSMYSFVFDALVRKATAAGFAIVTYDRPGRGRSPWPAGAVATQEFSVAVLRALAEHLGVASSIDTLVGISMGAAIAACYVAEFGSAACKRLVLMAPAGLTLPPPSLKESLIWLPGGVGRALFCAVARQAMVESQPTAFAEPNAARNRDALAQNVHAVEEQWDSPTLGFAAALHSTLCNWPLGQSAALLLTRVFRDVEATNVPVCIFWGDQDTTCPFENLETIRVLLPSARVHIVRGAAHELLHERFDETGALLLQFASGGGGDGAHIMAARL